MKKKRLSDGTFRGNHRATRPSPRTIRARWVECEVLKLKLLGVPTFHAIAQQITKVGRGQAQPVIEFPPGIAFPHDYSISEVACCKACKKGLARGPRLQAKEMRDLDTDRLEEGILAVQKGIKQGDPSAVRNLTQLITAKARLNGYIEARTLELIGTSGNPSEIKRTDDSDVAEMLKRLTREEQIEFMRLNNKARGIVTELTETKVEGRKADEETNESRGEYNGSSDPTAS
jgi:hypothetical protein